MKRPLHFAFFGSSLVSAYWNGAATYYRGLVRALAARGHVVTFYEPDAYQRQEHRDIPDPSWARVVVYSGTDASAMRHAVERARGVDVVIKCSGVGVWDTELEAAVLELRSPTTRIAFLDVDAPATLERITDDVADPFRALVPQYDFVFTYGGGDPVVQRYLGLGARACVPIYNALDPETHFASGSAPDPRFAADLGFLGNRLPDREARVDDFFFRAAQLEPGRTFLLGGSGWDDKPKPPNVTYAGHVYTADHNAFNTSTLCSLNVARDTMAANGFSPATRVFEAAGAGACLITDAWEGIELFLEPEQEILVARDGSEVARILRELTPERARDIGEAARRRVLAEHTYAARARQLEQLLTSGPQVRGALEASA